jgi:hypothetical protein
MTPDAEMRVFARPAGRLRPSEIRSNISTIIDRAVSISTRLAWGDLLGVALGAPVETFPGPIRSDRMAPGKTVLERAFEIAVSGEVVSLRQLARALRAEGYDATEIVDAGRVLRRQLNELMAAAQPSAGGSTLH